MKRSFPFPFLFLLVFGLFITPKPVLAEYEQNLENAATFLQNQFNEDVRYSLRFEKDTADRVQIADDSSLEGFTEGVTLCAWARPNYGESDGINGFVFNNERYALLMGVWGVGFNVRNESGDWAGWVGETTTFIAGRWYFLVGRYDATAEESQMFLDAVPYDTEPLSGAVYSTTYDHSIGTRIYIPTTNPFWGDIAWVAVYDHPLSNAEINYTMKNYANPITEGLRLWLPMDEGEGLITYDQSGYGNDGDLLPVENPPSWVQIPTLNLCRETFFWRPNYYWLIEDNLMAYHALKYYNETMANAIYSKLQEYGYLKNFACEALFKQTVELPFRYCNNYTIEEGAGYIIKLDMYNGSTFTNWDNYANLLCYAALSKYWECWSDSEALTYFNKVAAMWDGTGIIDEVNNEPEDEEYGKYNTYKIALLLYAERILGQSLDFHDTAESIMWQMQNSTTYGINTHYDSEFQIYGDVNTETTSLVIGAYKYSFSRSCPTPSISPTRKASGDLAQTLMVLAIAMYLGTFLLRKNKRGWR